jgi:hypothetical protein
VPSESHLLQWSDVDWERGRLHVRSPKTERYEGHDARLVPIEPRLMELLRDALEVAHGDELRSVPAAERIIAARHGGQVFRRLRPLITSAGVKPWPRLFQTLRASCEKEWAERFPQYAVSKWIGHSITVSGKHYANAVPDELFDRAAAIAEPAGQPANAETAPRNAPIQRANQCDSVLDDLITNAVFDPDTKGCEPVQVEPGGFEPPCRSSRQVASTRVVAVLISA